MDQRVMRTNPNLADCSSGMLRLPPLHSDDPLTQTTRSSSSDAVTASDLLSSPPLRFPSGSLAWKPSKSGSDPESGNNSATKRCPSSPAIFSSSNSNFPSSVTLPHQSPPSRSSPAVAAVSSPVSSPGPPVSSPVSSPSHLRRTRSSPPPLL